MGLTRKAFIGGGLAASLYAGWWHARKSKAVGSRWRGWTKGEYQVHFIHTGRSESSFHIFPDGTTMLLDCGAVSRKRNGTHSVLPMPSADVEPGEVVARYVLDVNPNKDLVDYMVSSHWHVDHVGNNHPDAADPRPAAVETGLSRSGFGQACEFLHFRKALDRSWPDFNDPVPIKTRETEHMKAVYAFLRKRDGLVVEKFIPGRIDQIVPLREKVPGFFCRNLCANGRYALPDGTIKDPIGDYIRERRPKQINENTLSLGMIFGYGPFRYFTAGDVTGSFNRKHGGPRWFIMEEELAEAVEHCHVAKLNHHGYLGSMPPKLVKALSSRFYLNAVWDPQHTMAPIAAILADKTIYPGERTIIPCDFPTDRQDADASQPWFWDVAREIFSPSHVILSVRPGGASYTISCLDASRTELIVRAQFQQSTAI